MMNEDQSLRGRFCWTQEELTRNLLHMGCPNIWKNGRGGASSSRNGNAALRAGIGGFDLAAHFLHAIVVSVDFMTFQTRNRRDAAEKFAGAVDSKRLCGIDRVSFLIQMLSRNSIEISTLGV
jgi:hypothetical protein